MAHGVEYSPSGDASLVGFVFHCDKLGRDVTVHAKKVDVEKRVESCELCGDHGYVGLEFLCECKKRHSVLVEDW